MKKCSKCKEEKPLDQFPSHPNTKDKKGAWCRKCHGKLTIAWARKNKEKVLAQGKERRRSQYQKDSIYREKVKIEAREYRKKNSEEISRRRKSFKETNPDKYMAYYLNRFYKISLDEYRTRLAIQNGRCVICRELPGKRPLCVDHNHNTGDIRGLLCDNCNMGLARFKDDPQMLLYASRYLIERDKCDEKESYFRRADSSSEYLITYC